MPEQDPYQPIDCGFYDRLEAAIVLRKVVQLAYRNLEGDLVHAQTRLSDLCNESGAEYVLLLDGPKVRLDRIQSLDGVLLPDRC